MLRCAECECVQIICKDLTLKDCNFCTKKVCCCVQIHKHKKDNHNSSLIFLRNTRHFFAAALAIEILCVSAAVIGENTTFYFIGYNLQGIILGYVAGYAAAGFVTFIAILGRYDTRNTKIDSCCSVLEQHSSKSFLPNLTTTFRNFALGLSKLPHLYSQPNLRQILKTSFVILVTAESACILTAETVDLIFYKQSILLSIPLALLAGSFTVVAPEAYKKMKRDSKSNKNPCC
jgi:hypothetical protein